jgi:hypothetical protein
MKPPVAVRIHYLCEHTTALPALADAFRRESPEYFRDWSTSDMVERLLKPSLQRDALPLTLVAVEDDRVPGDSRRTP